MSKSEPLPPEISILTPIEVDTAVPEKKRPSIATENGGREAGLDPTRYGDWEKNGRCIDF